MSIEVVSLVHLIVLGFWGGVVATEAVIELYPFRRRAFHRQTITLHYWIDLLAGPPPLMPDMEIEPELVDVPDQTDDETDVDATDTDHSLVARFHQIGEESVCSDAVTSRLGVVEPVHLAGVVTVDDRPPGDDSGRLQE